MKAFAEKWWHVLPYLLILAVFVWTVHQQSETRKDDARVERNAALAFCVDSNKRTALIREFIYATTGDPPAAQYDFITDPELRRGVMEQSRASRAAMRARVEGTFRDRDCPAEFPAPPDGN